ncbi:hypothetical protein [Pseudarthrobacter sp. NIBRBAC000502770]|uniref:hypothetical protein n=1 Tax=Pseudarthrobacter sp. NIBRBAC000502770 TaxID=2590785 RepID=UPI0011400DB9|nr:hypothetical protein [Pseudarthrobacter sp. NIBRBAC000502770]QDG88134.1 hypothetical protein NIBR502770_06335 [Pseudarthrobacter sp. NIBRBAC000502770]
MSFAAAALIKARSATVWEIITDAGNFIVWPSAITWIDGEPVDGNVIRIKTARTNTRTIRTCVMHLTGQAMR